MAAFNKYQQFVEDLAKKVHNLDSDVLKVALSNSPPNAATHKLLADITEISAGNGYAAGGNTAAFVSGVQTAGTYKLVLSNVTFTAAAGSIATFQYAVLYNSTSSSPLKPLIGWYDYGTSLIVTSGNSFTVQFDATNGVLTLA
jgi:hypothetical protein